MRWLLVLALGCGAHHDEPATTPRPPAEPTCAELGVILRGPLVDDDKQAGPAREAAIAAACTGDHWPAPILACVASSRTPQQCLDKLDAAQKQGLDAKLASWAAQFGGSSYGGSAN